MTGTIIFDPLFDWVLIGAAAVVVALVVLLALWRGLSGWWLRALAGLALLAALANPSFQQENRSPLTDIIIALVDQTASQRLSDREVQTTEALAGLERAVARRPNSELRVVELTDDPGDGGTLAMTALAEAIAEEPRARIAGVILISDGRVHDLDRLPDLPAPLHLFQTGRDGDWDRRLVVENAPAFAIIGEEVSLTLRIEDQGDAPSGARVPISISIDGEPPLQFDVPVGTDIQLPLTLTHGGQNVVQVETPVADGELTDRNNAAVIQINGVRDRLRVLLVSGEPHAGERTWRNLLKSDSSVDLIHFTILRPPEKQDGVPPDELSLIAFPTRELFLEKIEEFDLIIFDRYRRRGILTGIYFDSIRDYVLNGGAVLVAAGPEFADASSIWRSSLGEILPGAPTARIVEEPFVPMITDLGQRHPVTAGLDLLAPGSAEDGTPGWGRWLRLIDVFVTSTGSVVMAGSEDRPLLILDRPGEGRVALLTSDHAWLWSRGYEGGGPQLELLRRLAHWMMGEPELEEEALVAEDRGGTLGIIRRTMGDDVRGVIVTHPDGREEQVPLFETGPGVFEAEIAADEMGLYRLTDGEIETIVALGPAAPREFVQTIATDEVLAPALSATGGTAIRTEEGIPALRDVRPGRPTSGNGWIGVYRREAYLTDDISVASLVPPWLFLLLSIALIIGAWLREGRR